MAKPELGKKYTCPKCPTKFYDLHREHFTCPTCDYDPRADEAEVVEEETQDEELLGMNDEESVEDADRVKETDEDEDEDDLEVEEIEMDDASAESRLMEMSGSDDDDTLGLGAEGIDDEEDMEVGDLEDVSFVSGGDDDTSSDSDDSDD